MFRGTIDPLGLFHLAAVAKQEGWGVDIRLVEHSQPFCLNEHYDMVGFSVYTGLHQQAFKVLYDLRVHHPDTLIVVGGPHATCFPESCDAFADYVVVGQGAESLKDLLCGSRPSEKHLTRCDDGPLPVGERQEFYAAYPEFERSPIKSLIGSLGCKFSCSYCYNSFRRPWRHSTRPVDLVLRDAEEVLRCSPCTRLFYFQDDVFGADLTWLKEFSLKFPALGVPFHAQARVEMIDPATNAGNRRLDLLCQAGCTGLTVAIESSSETVRTEVLNRRMDNGIFLRVLTRLGRLGLALRTEQMLGLPAGATEAPTPVNLELDLDLLEFNVRLREETGLPTVAWASVFTPYYKTRIWEYCRQHGHYTGTNDDLPATFFEESRLRFPSRHVGPSLAAESDAWLDDGELSGYRQSMLELQRMFHLFAAVPKGHLLARKYLERRVPDIPAIAGIMKQHLYDELLYEDKR